MPVVMKGGTSGMKKDYLAPVPSSGSSQPVLDTSTRGGKGESAWNAPEHKGTHPQDHPTTMTEMPTGATFPTSGSDIQDPTAVDGAWGPGVTLSKSTYTGPDTKSRG